MFVGARVLTRGSGFTTSAISNKIIPFTRVCRRARMFARTRWVRSGFYSTHVTPPAVGVPEMYAPGMIVLWQVLAPSFRETHSQAWYEAYV